MAEQSRIQTKTTMVKPAVSLSQPGLLQHTCACGGVAGLSGQCEDCASQRLSGGRGGLLPDRTIHASADPSPPVMQRMPLGGYSFGDLAIGPKERLGSGDAMAGRFSLNRYAQPLPLVQRQVNPEIENPEEDDQEEEEPIQAKALPQLMQLRVPEPSFPRPQTAFSQHYAQRFAEGGTASSQLGEPSAPRVNQTGLPDTLKAGIENLSGLGMDDVRVHYNSPKPAELNALAYTQGTEIHVAPGQEEHLPHEAWHVVQQMQGRVKPTLQTKGIAMNDNTELENEAEAIRDKLQNQRGGKQVQQIDRKEKIKENKIAHLFTVTAPIQCVLDEKSHAREIAPTQTGKRGKAAVHPLKELQSLYGNRAVNRLLDVPGIEQQAGLPIQGMWEEMPTNDGGELEYDTNVTEDIVRGKTMGERASVRSIPIYHLRNHVPGVIQLYRPSGYPPANQEELKDRKKASDRMAEIKLSSRQFFHVTSWENFGGSGQGIFSQGALDPQRGGKGGASAALGGAAGAAFAQQDVGYSFASKVANVCLEYFELYLAKAVCGNDPQKKPVILLVTYKTGFDAQPDEAQQDAIKTPHGFEVRGFVYTSEYPFK